MDKHACDRTCPRAWTDVLMIADMFLLESNSEAYYNMPLSLGIAISASDAATAYFLIVDALNLQRLDDVSNELWVNIRIPDFSVQQHSNCSLTFRADLLRLVAHIQLRDRNCGGKNKISKNASKLASKCSRVFK